MHSESSFIFSPALGLSTVTNSDNKGNIYGRPLRFSSAPDDTAILVYKKPSSYGTEGIKNYLAENVYNNDNDEDPYISLIKYFNNDKLKSLKLRAADFAYLKDLGVYPVNRLWILRRFPDNCVVPNNLLDWGSVGVEAISTVVGWIADKEDSPMLSLNFSEVWTDQTEMIDKVLTEMLSAEFGLSLPSTMSVPGWSQGILFGMLNAMKLTTDFNETDVPTGNPNVLRTAKMREVNSQGLKSEMSFSLETSYEQKYINGIDPGAAMLDIVTNLLKMGTSDQKFVLSDSDALRSLFNQLNSKQQTVDAWFKIIEKFIKAFITGITDFIKNMKAVGETGGSTSENQGETNDDQQSGQENDSGVPALPDIGAISGFSNFISGLSQSILAGTIQKYRWPLKGSIALMSGINTTPWHLTIGNPYSPIINTGNILVSNVDLKMSNDLGFNDMPVRIDVTISASLARPLGKQEIEKLFNNGYKRNYSQAAINSITDSEVRSNTSASGELTTNYVSTTQRQPSNILG